MAKTVDTADAEQTLNNGESVEVEVRTFDQGVDAVTVLIDEPPADPANPGPDPATYDYELQVYTPEIGGANMIYDEDAGVTFRSIQWPAQPPIVRFVLTNTSGGTATYRIVLRSFKSEAE